MLFNSPIYGIFLLSTAAVFWLLARHRRARSLFLVAASYAFYFYGSYDDAQGRGTISSPLTWSALCLSLIFVSSTIDFHIARLLARVTDSRLRKLLLGVSLAFSLGVLCVFKYYDFLARSLCAMLALAGVDLHPKLLELVLPFGISFFTFETMSYTLDVYWRKLEPKAGYLDYVLFVCFFPHLVAGPIVRPPQMLPQLEREPSASEALQGEGLWLIAQGVLKKILIGDVLAHGIVERVFEAPSHSSSVEVWVAVYSYAVQIYADFSGYTDIARGSAQLFGYVLPVNFDAPYRSTNLQEFWRRWHISLSRWLRDYLYIPLGGSQRGALSTYRNLLVTMLLGGLWHGASWNFVVWGGLHGVALCSVRIWQRRIRAHLHDSGANRGRASKWWIDACATLLTFHFVCFAWIFFRSESIGRAADLLSCMVGRGGDSPNLDFRLALTLVTGLALHFLPSRWASSARMRFVGSSALVQGVVLAAIAWIVHLAAQSRPAPFIYGQF